jgi:hypothetical protein
VAQERIAPDALLVATALSGSVGDVQDDPDAADSAWLTYDSAVNGNTDCRVSFPSPSTGNPSGTQGVRVQIRKNASGGNAAVWSLQLWEAGAQVSELATGTTTALAPNGEVVAGSFEASALAGATGADVEIRLQQTSGGASGSGGNRRRIEIGAVEWNAETAAASRTGSGATAASAQTADGDGTVTVGASGSSTATAQAAAGSGAAPISGAGTTSSTAQISAGTGTVEGGSEERTGSGATVATAQVAAGTGTVTTSGAGASTSGSQTSTGSSAAPIGASGSSSAAVQIAAGIALVAASALGASQASAQTSAGTGGAPVEASGASAASAQQSAGTGTVSQPGEINGSGATIATAQTSSGQGEALLAGTGGATAAAQASAGSASAPVTASGASTAAAQVSAGSGNVEQPAGEITGSGASAAAAQQSSGTGAALVSCSGASVASPQVSEGSDAEPPAGTGPVRHNGIIRPLVRGRASTRGGLSVLTTREILIVWERDAGPEDPANVSLTIRPKGGSDVVHEWPIGDLERIGPGAFRAKYTSPSRGPVRCTWLCAYADGEQGRDVDWFYAQG